MNFDLEKDFENQRWSLLALVDARESLSEGSQSAIATDLMILDAREFIGCMRRSKATGLGSPCRLDDSARKWASSSAVPARHPEAATPLLKSFGMDLSASSPARINIRSCFNHVTKPSREGNRTPG